MWSKSLYINIVVKIGDYDVFLRLVHVKPAIMHARKAEGADQLVMSLTPPGI